MELIDNVGASHVHMLTLKSIPLGLGTMEDCAHLSNAFVQKLFDCLNDGLTNFPVFNVTKLFSPHSHFEKVNERDFERKLWLRFLYEKFDTRKERFIQKN